MRNELYSQFGPRIIEAATMTFLDEINSLRRRVGLGTLSKELFEATILNNLNDTPLLDCEKDDPYAQNN